MSKLVFTFELPPVLNEQIEANRTNKAVGAKQKAYWTKLVAREAVIQNPDEICFNPAYLAIEYVIRTYAYDPDGLQATKKFIFDGLVIAGVLPNDNLKIIQSPLLEYFTVKNGILQQFVNLVISDQPLWELPSVNQAFGIAELEEELDEVINVG